VQHDSRPFFPLLSPFMTFLRINQSDLRLWVFSFFYFLCLSFVSFSCLFAAVVGLLIGLLRIQEFPRQHHRDGKSYQGVAKCSREKFYSEFFTEISKHFRAYFTLI